MKERGSLQQYWDAAPELAKRLGNAEDAAKAELEAMRKDAERYRFIRDADRSNDLIPEIGLYAMESLDDYVDAAMASCCDEK